MGVRRWLFNLLDRGEPPDRDPDELVEAAVVPASQGPISVALLERHGIPAVSIAQSRYPGGESLGARASIQVRRRHFDEAARIIDDEL